MLQNQDPEIQAKLMAMQRQIAEKSGAPASTAPSTGSTAAALQSRLTASQLHNLQQRKILASASTTPNTDSTASKVKVRAAATAAG